MGIVRDCFSQHFQIRRLQIYNRVPVFGSWNARLKHHLMTVKRSGFNVGDLQKNRLGFARTSDMAQMLNPANIRQMRDFLEIFNKVTENCFNHCVISFFERDVSQQENICIDRCVTKFLKSSHVAMNTYVEIQPKMVEKRIQEFNEMTEKNNQLKNEDSAPVTN